jgi:hypothetical protein
LALVDQVVHEVVDVLVRVTIDVLVLTLPNALGNVPARAFDVPGLVT